MVISKYSDFFDKNKLIEAYDPAYKQRRKKHLERKMAYEKRKKMRHEEEFAQQVKNG